MWSAKARTQISVLYAKVETAQALTEATVLLTITSDCTHRILTARTSKTRQSYAETAQAKAEAAAKEEANRRASENLSLRGQASRRLCVFVRVFVVHAVCASEGVSPLSFPCFLTLSFPLSPSLFLSLSNRSPHSHTHTHRHSSQEEKSPPRQFRGPVCSKLEESMTHCQAPPPSTSFCEWHA